MLGAAAGILLQLATPARNSGPDAGEEGLSFFASFPLVGFEDDIGELRAVCVWWLFGIVCVLISFLVCVYFPVRTETKFPPL